MVLFGQILISSGLITKDDLKMAPKMGIIIKERQP